MTTYHSLELNEMYSVTISLNEIGPTYCCGSHGHYIEKTGDPIGKEFTR